jgi:hypothetical protein
LRALVTQDTDRRDIEPEQTTFHAVETDPSRTEHTQEMAVGDALRGANIAARDHLVGATGDVFVVSPPGAPCVKIVQSGTSLWMSIDVRPS